MSHTNASLGSAISSLVTSLTASPLPAIEPTPTLPTSPAELAKLIDHTLLAPASTLDQIRAVCAEAKQHGTATVCVNSSLIPTVAAQLDGSGVKPIAVVGFPFGAANTQAKVAETQQAVRDGANEIDMVQNIGLLKSGEYLAVLSDIQAVVGAAAPSAIVKVIIETSLLTRDEIIASTYLTCLGGAAFVKTSTGYGGGGAKEDDVRLMHAIAHLDGAPWNGNVKVKASGGIRSLDVVQRMVQNGAERVGASGTKAILDEAMGNKPEAPKSDY
ncbi:uncharacterized protein PFL1_02977 [Pseudozyma flocculosa PF-1]|uniref:deoxyribose-phosphate aldolase n=2 Tax=Pseudozyma flocculosa TaxID=84751 RepID=A0A5C3F2M2_9BASI|nr:uncharacterized protein PFL1_02977 [Pseudozyma flocculosa PF-1]EPQ29758.1 hypothetical protein PFL1_02977 [Pseudozyma flocculosa PF-1]SPO38340.1 related to Deoxyribose-phosphate aldolase [Pseudozyma flocculosa]